MRLGKKVWLCILCFFWWFFLACGEVYGARKTEETKGFYNMEQEDAYGAKRQEESEKFYHEETGKEAQELEDTLDSYLAELDYR